MTDWWLWIVAALLLAGVEAITPGGFVAMFFAAGALLVGLLASTGLVSSLWGQVLLFSAFSVGSLLLFRNPLLGMMRSPSDRPVDSLVGEIATLMDDLPPDGVSKAELRGSSWTVRSAEARTLVRGQRCRVERIDGLTLWVRSE